MQNEEWEQEEQQTGEQKTTTANHSMWLSGKRPMHEMWGLPDLAEPQGD